MTPPPDERAALARETARVKSMLDDLAALTGRRKAPPAAPPLVIPPADDPDAWKSLPEMDLSGDPPPPAEKPTAAERVDGFFDQVTDDDPLAAAAPPAEAAGEFFGDAPPATPAPPAADGGGIDFGLPDEYAGPPTEVVADGDDTLNFRSAAGHTPPDGTPSPTPDDTPDTPKGEAANDVLDGFQW